MTYEFTRKIILTQEEQKVIKTLRDMFEEDEGLSLLATWEVLTAIANNNSKLAKQFNYEIEVTK